MDTTITAAVVGAIGAIAGALIALAGVLLQAVLTQRSTRNQSLVEARRVAYARLLSASMLEDFYPVFMPDPTRNKEAVGEYNEKMRTWRANRRVLKGIAAEALLLASSKKLRALLKEFIAGNDPDSNLKHVEDLLREEISL